ncbi:MAG: exodeoxyribonuclease VII small subunit [Acidimicrobiales bacterium]
MTDAEIGYADAMAELEAILDDLEDDDLDVDVLAARVERASN